jgi:arylsulfatase
MDTPYQWTKQVASHWGGTRNGMIVHWPSNIAGKGEIRSQFHHVIDVAPTILELAGLPEPTIVKSVQQSPMEGTSFAYTLNDSAADDQHTVQYFEMFCNRGIYHEGWTAVTRHSTPWVATEMPALTADRWELYGPDDWSQAHDLASEMPEKLAELQMLFVLEASKYNVFPLDDRRFERFNPDLAGRPQLIRGNTQLLFSGMGRLTENSVLPLKNKSFSITSEVERTGAPLDGVVIAQGGAFGGLSLYFKEGTARFAYNFFGLETTIVEAESVLDEGKHQVRAEFAYDGGGLAKGGSVTLYYDGQPVGTGRVERTVPMLFSADETTDVGQESGTPVSEDYSRGTSTFNGKINWVQLDAGLDDQDHLISPDERFQVAMARQ